MFISCCEYERYSERNLLIIGAGPFSTEIEKMARLLGYDDMAFIDDNPEKAISSPVIGTMKEIKEFTSRYQCTG